MKLPYSWILDYVDVSDIPPEKLSDILLNIGFEVEEIIRPGKDIRGVVTGKILDVKKHLDADKLSACMVDVGSEITTIVTGAHNISVGDVVPVARDGADLPGGKHIQAAPLRGVMSYGMMCSGTELGVDDTVVAGAEADGILILPVGTELGRDIREILRLNDCVLDISVTANRPDCQSVYGMCREIGTALSRRVKPLNLKYKTAPGGSSPLVDIEARSLCSRYTARVIEDVKIEPSPDWMRDRLRMAGIRPINNLVDITNYVLTEVGQPLHAFDVRFVKDMHIKVRTAKNGEKIVALDGNVYTLKENMLLIADPEKPLAIAGVMGGQYSGIMPDTSAVLLEAARFARGSVRATSRALGLRSDSSARYEKGVDWQSVDTGRERALSLISQLKAGKITQASASAGECVPAPKTIETSASQISDLLGISVKPQTVQKILKALCFETEAAGDKIKVRVPLFREDVENYTDLAEEVIRFYGYDNIAGTLLKSASATVGGLSRRQTRLNEIKAVVCGTGAYEITTYSFISDKLHDKLRLEPQDPLRRTIEILNPLSEEYAVMRTQLTGNMLSAVSLNLARKNKDFRLFEVGRTYLAENLPLETLPQEHETLCMGFTGSGEDFYSVKAAVTEVIRKFYRGETTLTLGDRPYLHPGMSADIWADGNRIGSFGKLHPLTAKNFDLTTPVFVAELDLEPLLSGETESVRFEPLPKYQTVERDLAVSVEESCAVGDLIFAARAADPLCADVRLFDIYRGDQIEAGQKSVAFSIRLQSKEKTLTDAEIQQTMDRILSALTENFNARLRL